MLHVYAPLSVFLPTCWFLCMGGSLLKIYRWKRAALLRFISARWFLFALWAFGQPDHHVKAPFRHRLGVGGVEGQQNFFDVEGAVEQGAGGVAGLADVAAHEVAAVCHGGLGHGVILQGFVALLARLCKAVLIGSHIYQIATGKWAGGPQSQVLGQHGFAEG